MDPEIARWILEFLSRQSIDDRVFNGLISVLPLPKADDRLMKFVLLRKISSEVSAGLISEKILDSLEMIEEIDHREGLRILDSIKEAYCNVAMECTVRCLRENPDDCRAYFDVVVRIWRGRILEMERWGDVGLVSDKLRDLRDEIEAAVWSADVRKNVLLKDARNDALESVRVFLKEAMEGMGPSFLEQMAQKLKESEDGREVHFPNDTSTANQIEERQGFVIDRLHEDSEICIENVPNDNNVDMDIDTHKDLDASTENVINNNSTGMDADSHVELPHVATNKHNLSLTPEVCKVQEALKSSSAELHEAVEDPLPDALRMAATISSNMPRHETNHEHSGENQNARGTDTCNPSVDAVHTKEVDTENQNAVLRPSIMVRNSTARTFEWDEFSVDSYDGSPNRLHLRTPRNRKTSPLIKHDIKRGFAGRRKKKKWSSLEEQTLRDAVKEYGRGNWKLILDNYRSIFEERTVVDLKDKWRNMTR